MTQYINILSWYNQKVCEWKKGVELSSCSTSCSRTFLELRNLFFGFQLHPAALAPPHMYPWAVCVCLNTHTCMWTRKLLQRRVDLCCLFNIAQNTTALSHLGKQVIAISIIYSDIQWSRPQTILTRRLTEINVAAHIQAPPRPHQPILLSRLNLFLFFSLLPIICFLLCSILTFIYFFSF